MMRALLSAALLLAGLYGAALLAALALVLVNRSARRAKRLESDRARPEVAAAVVEFAAGNPDPARIRAYMRTHREDLEECLLQYHGAMSGEARNRVAALALDLGLVHRWCQDAKSRAPLRRRKALARLSMVAGYEPSRRLSGDILHGALQDPDPEARLEAARTLVHSDDMDEIAEIFQVAVEHALIVRVILADDLRRHAGVLCNTAIPEVFRSGSAERVIAALDILAAWERAVALPQVAELVENRDRRIRVKALRVLPLIPASRAGAEAVHRALHDKDDLICIAAAHAAARMKLESALAPLARCLRRGQVELCRAAAAALASLPPRGWETLEELKNYPDAVTASASLEALERARKSFLGA